MKQKDFHKGHRQRLKSRYKDGGANALADHEMLEMLLFYAIPRRDTKPLAHHLISKYGSLQNVFSSPIPSLVENGLSENAAILIKAVYDIGRRVSRESAPDKKLSGYDEIGRFFAEELGNCRTERLDMLMLDGKDRVLGITNVGTGSLRQADVNTGKIAEECIIRKPSKVVFAHNHPSGSLEISINDHAATCTLELFVKQLGVEFLEHYIVADGKYVGIKMHEEKVKRTGEEIYLRTYGFGGEKE